jgi:hypothetical protein
MTKLRRILRSPGATAVLFLLAAALLMSATIGGTRAALTYYSEIYSFRVQMYDIGISLLENGSRVSWRDYGKAADGTWDEGTGYLLGSGRVQADEDWPIGVSCGEELAVRNSGSIDEYVRVNIYKYWVDGSGEKRQDLDPALIELTLANLGSGWILDRESSTPERTVLYYDRVLSAGETTPNFTSTLTVSSAVTGEVTEERTQEGGYTEIDYSYDYDGVAFQIEVEAEAVQTHNGEDAIQSAWGPRLTLGGGRLRLLTEGEQP